MFQCCRSASRSCKRLFASFWGSGRKCLTQAFSCKLAHAICYSLVQFASRVSRSIRSARSLAQFAARVFSSKFLCAFSRATCCARSLGVLSCNSFWTCSRAYCFAHALALLACCVIRLTLFATNSLRNAFGINKAAPRHQQEVKKKNKTGTSDQSFS